MRAGSESAMGQRNSKIGKRQRPRSANQSGEKTMSSKVNIEDAQAHLQQLIAGLNPGEPVTITKDGEPVATLTRAPLKTWPCKAGTAKDTSHWMAPDFDAPLEDFRDYMG